MSHEQEVKLTNHIVNISQCFGIAVSASIRHAIFPDSDNAIKYRNQLDDSYRSLGGAIADFAIWAADDER